LPKLKGGLRALYRTLELPGANPLKDAHATLRCRRPRRLRLLRQERPAGPASGTEPGRRPTPRKSPACHTARDSGELYQPRDSDFRRLYSPIGPGLAVTRQLKKAPLNRRDAMDAEADQSQLPRNLSLNGDWFERLLPRSSLCAHRVAAVPLSSPRSIRCNHGQLFKCWANAVGGIA
jgi:hypothetical protein